MDAVFEAYMRPILAKEGAYSDNKADSGGPTRYGVTEHTARACGYQGDMRAYGLEDAMEVYHTMFWTQPMFDQLVPIMPELASLSLDLGVNFGPSWPGRFLQRGLNVLSRQGTDYPHIRVDGVVGVLTRHALQSFVTKRQSAGRVVLTNMIRSQASVRYIEIAEADPDDEQFEFGWQRTRAFEATL